MDKYVRPRAGPARLLATVLLLHIAGAYGDSALLSVDTTTRQLWGGTAVRYLEDSRDELSLRQVLQQPAAAWTRSREQSASLGFTDSTYWFALRLRNGGDNGDFMLLCDYTALDEISFFLLDADSGELLQQFHSGDHYPFHSRPVDHASFAFPFELQAGQSVEVVLRVRSSGNIAMPLSVWSAPRFYQYQKNFYAIYSAVAGIMAVIGIFNGFIFFRTREKLFLWFSAFALSIVALFTSQAGLGFQLLWPNAVWWNEKCVIFTIALAAASHLLFSISFLSLKGLPLQLFRGLIALNVLIFLSSLVFSYQPLLRLVLLCAMVACVLSLLLGVYYWWRGAAAAKVYTLAWSAFIVGIFTSASIRFGIAPYNMLTEFAGLFGALATVVVFSITIADRINSERQDRIRAQHQAIQSLEKFELLFENSVAGIFVSTISGRLSSANTAFVTMLGYTSLAELLQRINCDILCTYKATAQHTALMGELLESGRVIDRELELLRSDGSGFWVSTSMWIGRYCDGGDHIVEGAMIDISARKESERRLAFLASHDPLTNLFNRRLFEQQLEQALKKSRASETNYCVMYMDLDQFKVVNDTCGHSAGDILLRQLSLLMTNTLRERGLLARLGGDEFGVLLQDTDQDKAVAIAEEFRALIDNYRFSFENRVFKLGISIGVVALSPASESTEQIMILADTACYAAKDAGRNRVHVYSASNVELQKRRTEMELVSAINQALENNRFFLQRQPIVANDREGALFGWEILMYMQDEGGNAVAPDVFVPAAERYNLMPQIDRWVVDNCFRWLHDNPRELEAVMHCAINLSGHSLGDENILGFITEGFNKYKVPAEKICFELTESAAIHNLDHTLKLTDAFRQLGCRLSLDDFGSGFSSYAYLKNLPVDYIKIDGAFIVNIASDPVDYAMVRSINDVAKAMGMQTVAEFVEDEAIIGKLREIGVDYLQGYRIARPQPLSGAARADYFRVEEK